MCGVLGGGDFFETTPAFYINFAAVHFICFTEETFPTFFLLVSYIS